MEPKLKISKQMANFMQPARSNKDREKHNQEHKNMNKQEKIDKEEKVKKADKDEAKEKNNDKISAHPKKKSKNPFQPMHEWIKLSKMMENQMKEVQQGMNMQRFQKLSFELNSDLLKEKQSNVQQEIKYEDCLTLKIIKKNSNSCLKQILHVPTFTIYYLRESAIDFNIDKGQLQQWIKKCNLQTQINNNGFSRKIIKLYWNTPESYYSILYEFNDGIMLETILQNINSLPQSFLKKIIKVFLAAEYQIFNSQIFITKHNEDNCLFYLPVYEETDDLIHHQRNFRQLMKLQNSGNQNQQEIEKKMVARIGFFAMIGYFGDTIADEDISRIFFENDEYCCLIHRFLDNPSSLTSLYVSCNLSQKSNQMEKQLIIDFLCKCLRFQGKKRSSLAELKAHKFLKISDTQNSIDCSISQILRTLQYSGSHKKQSNRNYSRDISQHKMKKVLQSIVVILQGSSKPNNLNLDLSKDNPNMQQLVRDLELITSQGQMQYACSELGKKLKKIYS